MAKHDSEFEILFSKYNIAVAKAKDLQEQLATKSRAGAGTKSKD